MSRDVAQVFADIDAFDPDKFVAHLTPDAKFRFANADPVTGRTAVKKAVAGFFSTIDGLTHHIRNVYEVGDTVVAQIDVEYRREFIAFDDPFGNRLELVSQQETVSRPVAFTRPAGITEFGHLCLDAPDVHEAYRFWSTRFNARVSDWLGDAACLIRIDPVHHKLAVFRGERPGLCHMNFQVATIDDVFRNWHFLIEHGVEIEMGPGRHPQSGAVFLYFLGPEGFTYEYSFGVRRIEDDAAWAPRTFDPDEPGSIDMWLGPVRRVSSQPQLGAVRTEPVSTGRTA